MKAHWSALAVGVVIGALAGWFMGTRAVGAVAPLGNKTRFNLAK